MGYAFRLAARVLLYAPSHRQDSTYHGISYISRGALAGTRNSSMGPPWRIDPTTHRTMDFVCSSLTVARDDYNAFNVGNADVVGYIFQGQKNHGSCCCVDCYKCCFDCIWLAKSAYTDFKHLISQYIVSTWQDDWNGAVMNKLHSVKLVLGDWQSSYRRCRKDEIVLCRSYTFDPFIYLEERSSTSVWALSVYSDSSPHFGGVQSFCSRKERYIW